MVPGAWHARYCHKLSSWFNWPPNPTEGVFLHSRRKIEVPASHLNLRCLSQAALQHGHRITSGLPVTRAQCQDSPPWWTDYLHFHLTPIAKGTRPNIIRKYVGFLRT